MALQSQRHWPLSSATRSVKVWLLFGRRRTEGRHQKVFEEITRIRLRLLAIGESLLSHNGIGGNARKGDASTPHRINKPVNESSFQHFLRSEPDVRDCQRADRRTPRSGKDRRHLSASITSLTTPIVHEDHGIRITPNSIQRF